jgi:predicted nucleic acid-binding protein
VLEDASEHVDPFVRRTVQTRHADSSQRRPIDRIGAHAELAFVRSIASGELLVEPVLDSELECIAELTEQYLDLPLGIVDASIIALAERVGINEIATLDTRHFSVVRPRDVPSFTILP